MPALCFGECPPPLLTRFTPSALGLDFGCGEGKVLSLMAKARGYRVENYDLYYANHPELLTRQYDFITLTEVIEHVSDADALLTLLKGMIKPQGILAVMTKRVLNPTAFSAWHYKNDPTHINFYSEATFQWLAEHYGWRLEVIDKDVVFLHIMHNYPEFRLINALKAFAGVDKLGFANYPHRI